MVVFYWNIPFDSGKPSPGYCTRSSPRIEDSVVRCTGACLKIKKTYHRDSGRKISMSERRRRKSFWDIEEEGKPKPTFIDPSSRGRNERKSYYDDGAHLGTISASKSIDKSGRALWGPDNENPVTQPSDGFVKRRHDVSEAKETSGFSRFYEKNSPGFDRKERHIYDNAFDDDQSHFRRYSVRGRSRSRGRTSDRSRSRSLSRGREREQGRTWSRSRSRSRSKGSSRGHTRSCSPVEDYKRQSYGWSDRSRVPNKSSQSCRDFVEGSCRRGSQCRFVHHSPMSSYRGGDWVEDDPSEGWGNRASRSQMSKHSYGSGPESERQCEASDSYRGKNETAVSRSRTYPCKDFVRGNCRWADTCKFSHHVPAGDSFSSDSRVRTFDRDISQQSVQCGKPACKFFAMGTCDRNNCRFSHEDQKSGYLEARAIEVIDHHKSKWSDDAMRVSGVANAVGWGDTPATNTNSAIDITTGILTVDNVRNSWQNLEWKDKSDYRENHSHPLEESRRHDREAYPTESVVKGNVANRPVQLALVGSHVQNQGEVLNVQQSKLLENTDFSSKILQQDFSSAKHIQTQHHKIVENNRVNQLPLGEFEGEDSSKNFTHSLISSVSYMRENDEGKFPGRSLVKNESNQGRNMLYSMPSHEIITDLNVPEVKIVSHLHKLDQMPYPQMSMKSIDIMESKDPHVFPNLLNNKNTSQVTNLSAIISDQQVFPVNDGPTKFTAQKLVSDMLQVHQVGEFFSSKGLVPSFSDALVLAPLVDTKNVLRNPVTISANVFNSMENGRDNSETVNFSSGTEQNSLILVKHSSPLSHGIISDNSMLKDPERKSETLKQDEVIMKSEDKILGEERKDVKKVKPSDTLDGDGKAEEWNNNKDEKGMRVFKIALIDIVKEILKPTWKEGRMSRDVHKTVVKKVVDKVIGTIQADHIPKTQEKAEHYLSCCKPKIAKLVQAYVDRSRKKES